MSITVDYNKEIAAYSVQGLGEKLDIPLAFINGNRVKVDESYPQAINAFGDVLARLFQQKAEELNPFSSQLKDEVYFGLGLVGQKLYSDVEGHFNKMAEKNYDEGCQKVNWASPGVLFNTLQRHLSTGLQSHLDLGAGTGRMGQYVKELSSDIHVTGVDLAEHMLAVGTRNRHIDIAIKGDVTDPSLTGGQKFDLITCCGVLDFVPDISAFTKRVKASLAEEGIVAVSHEPYKTNHIKNKGHNTLQHLSEMIQAEFSAVGIKILEVGQRHNAYTSFTGGLPVEGQSIIGVLVR